MRSPSDTELASSCVSSAREASLTGVARCRGITGGQRGQLLPPGSAGEGHRTASPKYLMTKSKGKGSPYSITERRVPKLIPFLGSQPAGDVSHKPGGRLPLLSARPAVTLATLKRVVTNFAAW